MVEQPELPLTFGGATAVPASRRRARRACRIAEVALGASAMLALPVVMRPAPRLVWNASASMPIGLYWVVPGRLVRPGDIVVLRMPSDVRRLAAERGYQPSSVPLIKTVAAAAGDRVCARGATLTIDGELSANRLATDSRGRPLPWWQGCRTLTADEIFVLSTRRTDSFDGRYFGPVSRRAVVGTARLIW